MTDSFVLGVSALMALLAPALLAFRRENSRDGLYWALMGAAVAGPVAWTVVQLSGAWLTDLSTTLWITVASSIVLFAFLAATIRHAWRLTPLTAPYLASIGLLALIWSQGAQNTLDLSNLSGWILVHIILSVATYATVTVAAIAALSAFLQEKALKAKRPTALTRMLPSVADSEGLLVRLLILGECLLALGLVTGMASQYTETGQLIVFDHKTILTLTSFGVIGGLLFAHFRSGVRGRKAARYVLLAYLLLTLGYPGVKFVADVLLS